MSMKPTHINTSSSKHIKSGISLDNLLRPQTAQVKSSKKSGENPLLKKKNMFKTKSNLYESIKNKTELSLIEKKMIGKLNLNNSQESRSGIVDDHRSHTETNRYILTDDASAGRENSLPKRSAAPNLMLHQNKDAVSPKSHEYKTPSKNFFSPQKYNSPLLNSSQQANLAQYRASHEKSTIKKQGNRYSPLHKTSREKAPKERMDHGKTYDLIVSAENRHGSTKPSRNTSATSTSLHRVNKSYADSINQISKEQHKRANVTKAIKNITSGIPRSGTTTSLNKRVSPSNSQSLSKLSHALSPTNASVKQQKPQLYYIGRYNPPVKYRSEKSLEKSKASNQSSLEAGYKTIAEYNKTNLNELILNNTHDTLNESKSNATMDRHYTTETTHTRDTHHSHPDYANSIVSPRLDKEFRQVLTNFQTLIEKSEENASLLKQWKESARLMETKYHEMATVKQTSQDSEKVVKKLPKQQSNQALNQVQAENAKLSSQVQSLTRENKELRDLNEKLKEDIIRIHAADQESKRTADKDFERLKFICDQYSHLLLVLKNEGLDIQRIYDQEIRDKKLDTSEFVQPLNFASVSTGPTNQRSNNESEILESDSSMEYADIPISTNIAQSNGKQSSKPKFDLSAKLNGTVGSSNGDHHENNPSSNGDGGLKLNLQNLGKDGNGNKIIGFHDEMMGMWNEFSNSWRQEIKKDKTIKAEDIEKMDEFERNMREDGSD